MRERLSVHATLRAVLDPNRKTHDLTDASRGGMQPLRLLATAALLAPITGCVGTLDAGDFTLTPSRIGWNVTDIASFDLEVRASRSVPEPRYAVDPVFAIQSVTLDTGGLGGDFETPRPEELGLELRVDGVAVQETTLSLAAPRVEVRFRVPEELKDDTYTLTLVLFEVGEVESSPFRVNIP